MSLNDLIARAQQGDQRAIARLITRSLADEGIVARAQWQHRHLQLRLESDYPLAPSQIVPRLRQGFQRLEMTCPVTSVQVGSYPAGQDQPSWVEEFALDGSPLEAKPKSEPGSDSVIAPQAPPPPISGLHPDSAWRSDSALVAFCHLAPLFSYLILLGDLWVSLPWFWGNTFLLPWRIIAPLVVLLIQDQPIWVRQSAREALNFQISMLIYWLVTFALMRLLVGFLLVIPLAVVESVIIIIAAVKAGEGQPYRYPFSIRFVQS